MKLWTCKGCAAKDAELSHLRAVVDRLTTAPQAVGVLGTTEPAAFAVTPEPLPLAISDYLNTRYEPNSKDWRQEARAARQLIADGTNALNVLELLKKGQPVEW